MAGKIAKTIEEYKAPWEIDADGNDLPEDQQVVDPAKLKRYLFGLISDKEKAVEARDTAQRELAAKQADLDAAARKDESDEQRRQREQQDRDTELAAARAEALEGRKLKVALKQQGITAEQAADLADLLKGETDDEFDAHAKRLIEKFGLAKAADPDDDDEDEEPQGRPDLGRPRQRLRSGGDPAPNTQVRASLEDELATIPRPGSYY